MVLELVGSRLLAPFVGTSIVIWTSLIGVILAALSAGYYYGGRLADKNPDVSLLSKIIFTASLLVCLIVGLKFIFFEMLRGSSLDLGTKSVVLSLLLFALPSILLGMVSPFAAKLKTTSIEKMGGTIGNLSALSTIGSITGTFLAGFYLIAAFPVTRIITGISVLLLLCSLLIIKPLLRTILIRIVLFLGVFLLSNIIQETFSENNLLSKNTQYNNVAIYESVFYKAGRPVRIMSLDGKLDSAMYLDSDELVFDYTKYYRLAEALTPEMKRILVIGGAGYSVPKYYLNQGVAVDVVEIDPELTQLAEKYFNLQPTTYNLLTIFHEDGRTFLNRSSGEQYDAIMVDAFKGYSIPFQLTTLESVRRMHALLKPKGVVLANVISSIEGEKGLFLQSEYNTFKQVFPEVSLFAVNQPDNGEALQNLMLVGSKTNYQQNTSPEIAEYLKNKWTRPIPNGQILTDNYAPVDQLMLATNL